jgi:hypothetical protein
VTEIRIALAGIPAPPDARHRRAGVVNGFFTNRRHFLSSADASDWPLTDSGLPGPVTLTAVAPMSVVVP